MAFHFPEGTHQGFTALPENGTSLYPHLTALLNRHEMEPAQGSTSTAFPLQKEHVSSTFHDLLASSRTSARLHGSMLDVEIDFSFVDLALPRAPLSSRDLVSSSSLKPLLHQDEPSRPVLSCRAKMSCSVICGCRGDGGCSADNPSEHSPTMGQNLLSSRQRTAEMAASQQGEKTPYSLPGRSTPKSSPLCGADSLYLHPGDIKNTEMLTVTEATGNPFKSLSMCPLGEKHLTKSDLCHTNNTAYKPHRAPHLLRQHTHNATGRDNKGDCPRGLGRQIPVSTSPKGTCYLSNETHTSTGPAIHTLKGSVSSGFSLERRQSGRKGTFLSTFHQTPPIPPDATATRSRSPEHTVEERFLALYTFHLQQRCFGTWLMQWRMYTQARLHCRKHLLNAGLSALRGAVLSQQARTDMFHRRMEALTLAHCFQQWRIRVEDRKREPGVSCTSYLCDEELDGLRRRLTQPSDTLALRTAHCTWRSRTHGLPLHRAALIHYHLNVLWKYWLLWRKIGCRRRALSCLEQRAALHWENRLMRLTYTIWTGAVLTRQHHRAYLLATAWRQWRDQAVQRMETWSALANRSECFHRMRQLQYSFQQWRARAEDQTRQRNILLHSGRRCMQRWHVHTHRSRLQRLCTEAQRAFSSRKLAVAFGEWRQRKVAVDVARVDMFRGRHLLERRRMEAVFRVWHGRAEEMKGATDLLGRRMKAHLVIVIQRWHGIVKRERACVRYRHRRDTLTATLALSAWRRATTLRSLHTHVLTHLLHDRRMPTTHTQPGLAHYEMMIQHEFVHPTTLEEVFNYLQLQRSFHVWRKEMQMLQRARLYYISHTRKLARSALQQWHCVAQDAQACRVLRFQAKLAAGGCLTSTSSFIDHKSPITIQQGGIRDCEGVLRCVLARMLHPSLSKAFSQWRDYVQANKEQRSLTSKVTAQLAYNHRRALLNASFSQWCRQYNNYQNATKHRERVLLTSFVAYWRWVTARRGSVVAMEMKACHLHTNRVLRHSLSTWQKRRTLIPVQPDPEVRAQMVRKLRWLQRRGDRWTIHSAFTLWTARLRQNLAVNAFYTRLTTTRVFMAWQSYIQSHEEMKHLAQRHVHSRVLLTAMRHWRRTAEHQLKLRRRTEHRLTVMVRDSLHRWTEHAVMKRRLKQLLHQHLDGKQKLLKTTSWLSWLQEVDKVKKAQDHHHWTVLSSHIQQWHVYARHRTKVHLCLVTATSRRVQHTLRFTFTSWRGCALRKQSMARTAIYRWKRRLLEVRAARHHVAWQLSHWFYLWKLALGRRRETRRIALELCREWARHARQAVADHGRAFVFSQERQKREVARRWACWVKVYGDVRKSVEFHQQKLCHSVLLSWHSNTSSTVAQRQECAMQQAVSTGRLMTLCFNRWRCELDKEQHRQEQLEQRMSWWNSRLTERVMKYWRMDTRGSSQLKKANRRRLKQCFQGWRQRAHTLRAVTVLCVQRQHRNTKRVLRAWREWTRECGGQRQMSEAVYLWIEGRMVNRFFQLWLRALHLHKEASRRSSIHILRRFIQAWRGSVVERNYKLQMAQARIGARHVQSAFSVWRTRAGASALAERQRSLNLTYWSEETSIRGTGMEMGLETKLRECVCRWRCHAFQMRMGRTRTQLLWDSWRDQTAAVLLLRTMHTDRLRQAAWLTWRKRYITWRVSCDFSAHYNRMLLAQVFIMWRRRRSSIDSGVTGR